MPKAEDLAILKEGASALDAYRRENPLWIPDLSAANLRGADLQEFNLANSNLSKAHLAHATLRKANLAGADLTEASLFFADLLFTDLSNATLKGATMVNAGCGDTKFSGADLSNAICFGAFLGKVDFSGANLSGATLSFADIINANVLKANLSRTDLCATRFHNIDFNGVDLSNANMISTVICNSNLDGCIGLESIHHSGPSSVDVSTLIQSYRKAGNRLTPETEIFFVNLGFPKAFLDELPHILKNLQFYTCFICHGEPDRLFAERLVLDLKKIGVQCWLYSMDAIPGERVWAEIAQKRHEAEKMVVLCSVKSLIREGVKKEIEEQIDEDWQKIIPISLDNSWKEDGFSVKRGSRDLKGFLIEKNYADCSDESKYRESLRRLMTAIKRK